MTRTRPPGLPDRIDGRPSLSVPGSAVLPELYRSALHTVLDLNVVPGRNPEEPSRFLRAGAGYSEPWTRDAAINAWNGVSALDPELARDTLRMVCRTLPDGRRAVAQDEQWWDQIIWAIGAWHHILATGDDAFLAEAYSVSTTSLEILDRERFDRDWGLYRGGAVMQDGIAGYPTPPNDPTLSSSFVGDYPLANEIMSLSTNAVYVGALQSIAGMAEQLGDDPTPFAQRAEQLADAVNRHLWLPQSKTYGYFVHGAGPLAGQVDEHAEALGLAFAVIFGVAGPERATAVIARAPRAPHGVVSVWPHFADRYSDARPGRHNMACWPMIMGMFADAAARTGDVTLLDHALGDLERLIAGSSGSFFELYDAQTGKPDGGWQSGVHWDSEPDQTWSASALVRAVHLGLFGIRYAPGGLRFDPVVPPRFDGLTVGNLRYRAASLTVTVRGHGARLQAVELDGVTTRSPIHLAADLVGRHDVVIRMGS